MARSGLPALFAFSAALAAYLAGCSPRPPQTTRIIEINTNEVTAPDITVSPDSKTLVFSLLGQLVSLPTAGGVTRQLTFGPYYHHDPTFSPDGQRLAFLSNRDGSEDNVFVMDLASREIRKISSEPRAGSPSWSPDGRKLTFLSYPHASRMAEEALEVLEVDVETLSTQAIGIGERAVNTVFYSSRGEPAWSVVRENEEGEDETLIELAGQEDPGKPLDSAPFRAGMIRPSPDGHGFLARTQATDARIVWIRDGGIHGSVSGLQPVYSWYGYPRFGADWENRMVYFGEDGALWRGSLEDGSIEEIPFTAAVELTVVVPPPIPTLSIPRIPDSPTISSPRLTPDGKELIFGALGFLWRTRPGSGRAERFTVGDALERDPAISPDGRYLAYIRISGREQELRVRDLGSDLERSLYRGPVLLEPAWSGDGGMIVTTLHVHPEFSVVVLDATSPEDSSFVIRVGRGASPPRPHFSPDGRWLYHRVEIGDTAKIRRVSMGEGLRSEALVSLPNHLSSVLVSPGEEWIAFNRGHEVWVAPLEDSVVDSSLEGARQISDLGGRDFTFGPGGESLLFAERGRVWRQSISGGASIEVSVNLSSDHESPPPLLLRGVRVLDFSGGGFSEATSILVEDGRIRRIEPDLDRSVTDGTEVIEATGRYVIPGLIDVHNHVGMPLGDQVAFLTHGVTTVRDMGGRLRWLASLSERSAMMPSPLPRYLYAGDFLLGGPRNTPWGIVARSEEEIRSGIQGNRQEGASFTKVYFSLPWPLQVAAAHEAHRLGLPVAAHGTHVQEAVREVTLGFRFLEHIDPGGRFHGDVQELLALSGTYWTPTLSLGGTGQLLTGDLASASARGVNLLLGTDEPVETGVQFHQEMEAFVRGGLSPLEVLEASTLRAAEALGVTRDLGSIEAGKLADLVILDGNPLEEIGNTRLIWRVIKGGWVFDPEELVTARGR